MDGSGWSAYITAPSGAAGGAGVLPGTPSHRAVWHYGLGDAQVSWLGCHLVSRAAGAVMFASNVHEARELPRAMALVEEGRALIARRELQGLRSVCDRLAELMPVSTQERTRAFSSGLR
jgi:hypothetical protein